MIDKPKIISLDKSFDALFRDLKKYHEELAKEEYDPSRFKWFRPERVQDITNAQDICEPYSMTGLDKTGQEYIDPAKEDGSPVRKDYCVLEYEVGLLQAFARAFNERHTSKLRSFSHSAGVSGIMSMSGTGIIDELYTCAGKILAAK